jgi:hypothetical protein
MIDNLVIKEYSTKDKRATLIMDTVQKQWFCKKFRNDFLKCINGLKAKNNLPPDWNEMDESILDLDCWMGKLEDGGYDNDPYKDAVYVKLKKACDKLVWPFEDLWPFVIDSREPTRLEVKLHMDAQRRRYQQYKKDNEDPDSTWNNLFEIS